MIKSNMKHGYSIIEVLLAGVIFSLAASGVSAAIMFAQRSGQASAQQESAMRLAEEAVSALHNIRTRGFEHLVVGEDMGLIIEQEQWAINPNPGPEDDLHNGKLRRISIEEIDGIKIADISVTFPIGTELTGGQVTLQEMYADIGRESVIGVTSQSQNFHLSDEQIDIYSLNLEPGIPNVLGEAGSFTVSSEDAGGTWYTVNFSRSYGDPIVIGTANSEESSNPANIFEVRNITANSAEMRLCNSRITPGVCDPHGEDQIGGYVVVDLDRVTEVDGIDGGRINLSGGGNAGWTTATFGFSFSNTPLLFSTAQEVPGDFPLDTKVRNVTSSSTQLLLCHMTSNDACANSYPSTSVAWIAIDPSVLSLQEQFTSGIETANNSQWRTVSFSPEFTQLPVFIVENQTNNGGQNGEINSARNITNLGAEVRYCELDTGGSGGVGVCDNHVNENIAWLAIRSGLITFNITP